MKRLKDLFRLLIASLIASLPAALPAQPASTSVPLRFKTTGASLWGPRAGENSRGFKVDLLDQVYQGSEGNIVRIDVDIDNATAQAAWDAAVKSCDEKQYCHDFGFPVGRLCTSPTRQQCIDGAKLEILGVTVATVNGIGPRPSGTISKPFDVGAELAWDASLRWGFEGGITVDEGSVDVDFTTNATLEIVESEVEAGKVFTLRTSQSGGAVDLRSRWPNISGFIDTYTEARALLRLRTAGPNTETGQQMDETVNFFDESTGGEFHQELIGMRVGADGVELELLDAPFISVQPGIEFNIAIPVEVEGLGGIGLPVLDIGLFTPELDTPAGNGFDGNSINGIFDGTKITNTLSPGKRDLFNYGIIDGGIKDTDAARLDVDIDVLTNAAFGVPLGIKASAGTIIPGVLSLITAEGNVLDLDSANFLGFREDLTFEPRLTAILTFNQPVQVETSPGSEEFVSTTVARVRVGDDLRIIHPGGKLLIDPVYTLDENLFINDTDLIVNPAIQGTLFQLKFGGLVFTLASEALDLPINFAAAQITVDITKDPVKLVDMNFLDDMPAAEFPIGGFSDIPGVALLVRPGSPFRRGDGNADTVVDISDAVGILGHLFLGDQELKCQKSADVNDDGQVDISDPIGILGFLFLGEENPPAPGPLFCGGDPTDDALDCADYPSCAEF